MSLQARAHNFTLLLSTCSARGSYPELPIHSAGEASGTDALCREPGFLLARRRMRWRADGTCLIEASCAACSPPLAFFCKPRGTAPEPLRPRPKTHRRVPLDSNFFTLTNYKPHTTVYSPSSPAPYTSKSKTEPPPLDEISRNMPLNSGI